MVVSLTGNRFKEFKLNRRKKSLKITPMTQYNSTGESVPTSPWGSKCPLSTATFQPGQNSFCVTSSEIDHPDCKFPAKGFSALWDNGPLIQDKYSTNNVQCCMNSS